MSRGRKKKGWQLGGPNAPSWLRAPASPDVKRNTRDDLALLQRTFDIDALAPEHPVRVLWNTEGDAESLAEARFEFHHLASDLRTIAGVPGAARLIHALITDIAGYANYRYELRTAGSVGRCRSQRLISLGGKGRARISRSLRGRATPVRSRAIERRARRPRCWSPVRSLGG